MPFKFGFPTNEFEEVASVDSELSGGEVANKINVEYEVVLPVALLFSTDIICEYVPSLLPTR